MNMLDYQQNVMRTARNALSHRDKLLNGALGLGEAGEVQNLIKKSVYHGHDIPVVDVCDELGDILFYVTWLADTLGWSLEQVAAHNVSKLKRRYPDGFSEERSKNRDE